ncbi:MAG: GNAT family N-acetyltransferase [Acidimicrobiia bacterium]
MSELTPSPHPLDNAVWAALTTVHASAAEASGGARRYRSDVSPFGAVDQFTPTVWDDIAPLCRPGDPVVLFRPGIPDPPPGWAAVRRGQGHQMLLTDPDRLADFAGLALTVLDESHVQEMLTLVALTEPGPFKPRTIDLGRYVGVIEDGALVAMAGERFALPGFREISAVCTHPSTRGRGLAAALTSAVAAAMLERGEQPFLHVAAHNDDARRIYERLGFSTRTMVDLVVLEHSPQR